MYFENETLKTISQNIERAYSIVEIEALQSEIKFIKKGFVDINLEYEAKEAWILETILKIRLYYINAYELLRKKEYEKAWNSYDRSDINISFLVKHFDFSENQFDLDFISKQIPKFQKLFPYFLFMSREAIVKKKICSICGAEVSLRKKCGHVVGEIYAGEMCSLRLKDIEIKCMSFVENPFDKYTMIKMADMEYDYRNLEMLLEYLKDPFEKWDLEIELLTKPEYVKISRNDLCPCNSGIKYKNCCSITGKDKFEHYQLLFPNLKAGFLKPMEIVGTWKK